MIVDSIAAADKYAALHPVFKKSFEFLRQSDLNYLDNGRHEIDGDNLFAIVSRNGDSVLADPKMEVHRKYIDIHYVAAGTDTIGWKFFGDCHAPLGEYNDKDDYRLYADKDFASLRLEKRQFMIVFPDDVHVPLLETRNLFKIVLKVKIEYAV